WRIPNIVRIRFESQTQHRNSLLVNRPAQSIYGQLHDFISSPQINRINLFEKCHGLTTTKLLRTSNEGANIFGQTTPAKTDPSIQKTTTNAGVKSKRVGEHRNISIGGFSNFCHRVNKGNLGSKKSIRGTLNQLSGLIVSNYQWDITIKHGRKDLIEHESGSLPQRTSRQTVYQSIRIQGVVHRESFPKELW